MRELVLAYFAQNLGDDMFVRTLINRYPDEVFFLWGNPKYVKHFTKEHNVIIPNKFEYEINRHIKRIFHLKYGLILGLKMIMAKSVIRIGGSIFIEPNSDKYKPNRAINRYTFILGANYGPARTNRFKRLIEEDISTVSDCCFRDTASYSLFCKIPQVRYAPDILFGYGEYPSVSEDEGVGISVIDLNKHYAISYLKVAYENMLIDFCNVCLKRRIRVKLYSFCEAEGDSEVAYKIKSAVENPCLIDVVVYKGDIDSFLASYNQCRYIVATRFHAMLIGWCLNKRVLPIIYSIKQINVLNDIESQNSTVNLLNNEIISGHKLLELCMSNEIIEISEMSRKSDLQFQALDRFNKEIK